MQPEDMVMERVKVQAEANQEPIVGAEPTQDHIV